MTAAVSPVQRSDNALTSTAGPTDTDNDSDKITVTPCSPNLEHKDPHVDDSHGNKETTQSVVCV